MIRHLAIKNFALIEDISFSLEPGLTTVTGETGAGKSIILGAINLLAGNRADRSLVRNPDKKCVIEATFHIGHLNLKALFEELDLDYDQETIIRREFNKDGKSRVFVNDSPAVLLSLKRLMNRLLDVHSQHENLELNNKLYQLNALDLFAENSNLLHDYSEAYIEYREAEKALEELKVASLQLRENTDFLTHQLNELIDADLKEGEQEELEKEQNALSHSEEIKSGLFEIESLIDNPDNNPLNQVNHIMGIVKRLKIHLSDFEELDQRLNSLSIELDDIQRELGRLNDLSQHDPERTQIVEDRLSLLYQLEQKHRVNSMDALIEKREQLQSELSDIQHLDDRLDDAEERLNKAAIVVTELGQQLSDRRKKVADKFEADIVSFLERLGMPSCQFKIEILRSELSPFGLDSIEFLFSANKGLEAKPIGKVASGGELSRLMLSIKALLTTKSSLPTIIFDEIDTGISGEIAEKMGKIIRDMSADTQVMTITHLPQIAALGHQQMKVFKQEVDGKTQTMIQGLNKEERLHEIARLLSGEKIGQEAMSNAKVLLQSAG